MNWPHRTTHLLVCDYWGRSKLGLFQYVTVLAEIEAFREKFGSIESDARFDALARIYISRMMKR
ncbi:MAG: hypothetical protein IIB02_05350 [Thaumarchaeota archaeon]|nr:hypothetical protein [Nitrososphaerota archaeon]